MIVRGSIGHTPCRRCGLLLVAIIAWGGLTSGAQVHAQAEPIHAPRLANYRIVATYDQNPQTVAGHETLTWTNSSGQPASDLYFHLYLNAFANNRSSFVRTTGDLWIDWIERHPEGWGYITVQNIRVGKTDFTSRMLFVHPDDDNADDRTVFRLPLESAVAPGQSVDIEIDFVAKLPKIVARSGYAGAFAFVAQWFPKLGVFQDGNWNCHQYHLTTEFFSDFGIYDVTLTVPNDGIVGATGVLREERRNNDGTKTLRFLAEDVHDFAWTIDPRFRVFERSIEGTTVRLLLQPNHVPQLERHFTAVAAALRRYHEWIAPYPYPQLTMVDPGPGAGGAGGMEYPTLITVGTAWWVPLGLRLPEFVTVHEFGHQYWYGMVANNEFEDAWLDEGINTYVEGRIMDEVYGPGSYIDLLGLRASSVPLRRLQYLQAAHYDPLVRRGWEFIDRRSYSAISYAKTGLMLDTLAAQLGGTTLQQALTTYFQRARFTHPRASDFLETIKEVSGRDLDWYFEQVVSGTELLDYAVTRVSADELLAFTGYPIVDGHVGELANPTPAEEKRYRSEVIVERLGAVRLPVDVQIAFDDGSEAREQWDGQDRWKRFEYTGTQRVEWATVDPDHAIPLDVNLLNNSRMRTPARRGVIRLASRWGFWFQNLVWFLTGL